MNKEILNQYGIFFSKTNKGIVKVEASSIILSVYINMFDGHKQLVSEFIDSIEMALNDEYSAIPFDRKEWVRDVGYESYVGTINEDSTFELFVAEDYDNTVETYPLSDIKEIFTSFLETMNSFPEDLII